MIFFPFTIILIGLSLYIKIGFVFLIIAITIGLIVDDIIKRILLMHSTKKIIENKKVFLKPNYKYKYTIMLSGLLEIIDVENKELQKEYPLLAICSHAWNEAKGDKREQLKLLFSELYNQNNATLETLKKDLSQISQNFDLSHFLDIKPLPIVTKEDYQILGLSEEASLDEVRESYRKLSLHFHPDTTEHLNPIQKAESEEAFKRISNSYRKLLDILSKTV